MADEPVTREEAQRIQAAKAALYPDAAPPTQDMLSEAAADQDAAAAGAPARPGSPGADIALDQIVQKYTAAPSAPPEAPAEPAPEKADPYALGAWTNAAAARPPEFTPGVKSQVATADDEAKRRAEFNKLNPQRAREADARLAQEGRSAVIVSPGGMRPSSDTVQVTQGPEVSDADRLLKGYEQNATTGAEGDAAASKERDTALAGLESNYAQGSAKLAGGEQRAAQKQSDALSHVADRMAQALEASRVPVVSPAQDLSDMGMGQKLAFVLASAASTYFNRDIYKGPRGNPFLDGYNQMVDARIATQKAQAEQQKAYAGGQENLYSVMKQGFQSDDAARAAMRVMYLQALDTKMKEAALHYNIDAANPRLLQIKAGIDQQLLTNQEELAKISGKHVSEEQTSKYVPPSAIVVGGGTDPKETEKEKSLDKRLREAGADKTEADLDTLNSVVGSLDKNGAVARYAAEHGQSYANALFAMSNDPTQRQFIVDVQRGLKSEVSGNGMRSELGRDIAKTIDNPNTAGELYNRLAKEHAKAVADAIASEGAGGYQRYLRMRRRSQDIQHATNSPVRAQGAEPLPDALPEVP